MYLIRSVVYLILPFTFALISIGQVVTVDKVKFTSLQNDWLMSEVRISTALNTLPGATSKRFVENVDVRLYLGFKNANLSGGVDYFYSEVTALILERGDKNIVRFYIPGKIMKMNHYRKPSHFYAELAVNQTSLEPKSRAFSSSFQTRNSLENFAKTAKARGFKNLGRLMPSYLSPLNIVGSDAGAPTYLRIKN